MSDGRGKRSAVGTRSDLSQGSVNEGLVLGAARVALEPAVGESVSQVCRGEKGRALRMGKIGIKEHVILNKRGNSSTKRISGIKADALIDRVESTPVLEFNLIN